MNWRTVLELWRNNLNHIAWQFPIESTTQNAAQIDKENDTLLECITSTNLKYIIYLNEDQSAKGSAEGLAHKRT